MIDEYIDDDGYRLAYDVFKITGLKVPVNEMVQDILVDYLVKIDIHELMFDSRCTNTLVSYINNLCEKSFMLGLEQGKTRGSSE